jgi:hypothetical protein
MMATGTPAGRGGFPAIFARTDLALPAYTQPSLPRAFGSGARKASAGAKVRTLFKFFSITYLVTWICFISVATAIPGNTPLGTVLIYTGAVAPSLAALGLTARAEGEKGVRALLAGVIK